MGIRMRHHHDTVEENRVDLYGDNAEAFAAGVARDIEEEDALVPMAVSSDPWSDDAITTEFDRGLEYESEVA